MKKLGLIFDKKSKKVFLLPDQIKELTGKGVEIFVAPGYGKYVNIDDQGYAQAGAKLVKNNKEAILNADVVLKVNAFNKKEVALAGKKILVSFVNYALNADMILPMLKAGATGLAWNCLTEGNNYVFFSQLESIKAKHCVDKVIWGWDNKVGVGKKAKFDESTPSVLILNATYAAIEAAHAFLAKNIDVTIADDDVNYLKDLKESEQIAKLCASGAKFNYTDAKFETLTNEIKKHKALINTLQDPTLKTKPRITMDMARTMPVGSVLIDAACENGYAFFFQKGFAEDKLEFKKVDNFAYSCVADITNLYPVEASQIISKKSIPNLLVLLENGIASEALSKITIVKNGKVVNELVKTQLNLY